VLCLQETWHDVDSPIFERLRRGDFAVVDVRRPRLVQGMSVNHGGLTIVAVPSVRLSLVSLPSRPTTFEHICACLSVPGSAASVPLAVVYRSGSLPPSSIFIDELSSSREQFAVAVELFYFIGDTYFDRFIYVR
jgi:hypothetical protein